MCRSNFFKRFLNRGLDYLKTAGRYYVVRKVIPNFNDTIEEEIMKLIATGIKFGLNDKLMGAQIIPSFEVNKVMIKL